MRAVVELYDGSMVLPLLRRIDPETLRWIITVILALGVGVIAGLVWSFSIRHAEPVTLVADTDVGSATVTLEGFRDGALRGRSVGIVRLFAGRDPISIASDGSFAVDHPGFHIDTVTVQVPRGMQFVASKNGKKYYSVTSAGGERITPRNRVYFPDARSAELAGYRP